MVILFLIAFTNAVLGGIVGWFSRGRIVMAAIICCVLSLLFLAGLMIANASRAGLTRQNWLEDLIFYQSIPYVFFIGGPCFAGGVLTSALIHFANQHRKLEK
jgi:hypothetical protein